ncbi:MAG: ImmA/IrrE family metallo-endopeptidase [Solirubrobacterales bacterium]|nr:ImmA/IrrE family metallo-endopeptidase [Solirubrobacterales bacterium]
MDAAEQAEIEARAEGVLATVPDWIWNGDELPVPVEAIVDSHFGLLVRDVADLSRAPGCPEPAAGQTLSGLLLAARGEIWVNRAEAREWPGRRRFTIGHELGHWVMHRTGQQSLFCRRAQVEPAEPEDAGARPPLPVGEQEANVFAAALMMPAHLIRAEYTRDQEFNGLCARFGASGAAMSRRLRNVV